LYECRRSRPILVPTHLSVRRRPLPAFPTRRSSDLVWQQQETDGEAQPALQRLEKKYMGVRDDARRLANAIVNAHYVSRRLANHRSEERRVGKECRCEWWPDE